MQIYSQLAPLALGGAHGSAVAMGFFDGIHIGHRAVINGAVEWARAHGAAPAVFGTTADAKKTKTGRAA